MDRPNLEEIREELSRLMQEQIESLRKQTFLGVTEEDFQRETERLARIRELSADFIEALKNSP